MSKKVKEVNVEAVEAVEEVEASTDVITVAGKAGSGKAGTEFEYTWQIDFAGVTEAEVRDLARKSIVIAHANKVRAEIEKVAVLVVDKEGKPTEAEDAPQARVTALIEKYTTDRISVRDMLDNARPRGTGGEKEPKAQSAKKLLTAIKAAKDTMDKDAYLAFLQEQGLL